MNEYEQLFVRHSLPYTFSSFTNGTLDSMSSLDEGKFKSFVPGLMVDTRHPYGSGIYGALALPGR